MIWMPALLTGTSMVPNSDMVAAIPRLTASSSATSMATPIALGPTLPISSAAA